MVPIIGPDGTASYGTDGARARVALTDNMGSLAGIESEIAGESDSLPWLTAAHRADALAYARMLGAEEAVVKHIRNGALLQWHPDQLRVGIYFWPEPGIEAGIFVRGIPCRNIGSGVVAGFVWPHIEGVRRELANPGSWIMPWSSFQQRALMLRWLGVDKSEPGGPEAPDLDALIEHVAASPYMS